MRHAAEDPFPEIVDGCPDGGAFQDAAERAAMSIAERTGNLGGDLTEDRGPHVRTTTLGEGLPRDEAEVGAGRDDGYPRQAIFDLEIGDRGLQPGERAGPRTR